MATPPPVTLNQASLSTRFSSARRRANDCDRTVHENGLAANPRPAGCEKLSGEEKYRIRQGDYRILYEIVDRDLIVTVVRVGNRRDVYR